MIACSFVAALKCIAQSTHCHVHVCVEELDELRKKEKEAGYTPDWELDAFMKAEIRKGKKESIVTDLVIKMLGLDVSHLSHSVHPSIYIRGHSGYKLLAAWAQRQACWRFADSSISSQL